MEANLAAFEARKGSQVAILLVPTTQPEDIAQYSIRVVEQWKLGRKGIDDGVLVLLAKNDRAARIEVGYGLEGALPDAIAKRIVEDDMIPRFREGDFHGGLAAGVDRVMRVIDGEPLPEPTRSMSHAGLEEMLPILFFAAMILGVILRTVLGSVMGGLMNGGLIGLLAWIMGAVLPVAAFFGFMAFVMTLGGGRHHGSGYSGSGGLGGGGGFGGGGFSGGGGGFGGGGASGRW